MNIVSTNDDELIGEILVVEDNPSSLKLLSNILITAGYKVRPAPDGELALQSIKARHPDLILLDFNLPGIDGIEVCRCLKDDHNTMDIPIIFVSAIEKSELKVKALECGAIDFVTKPIDASEVLARIKTHLKMYCLQQKLSSTSEQLQKHQEDLEELVKKRTVKLLKREKQISAALKEKEVLLREIHHRVKNNMQIIVSLLNLHSRESNDIHVKNIFYECRNRIGAMSLIHQVLYRSKDVAHIDFNNYLLELSTYLRQAYQVSGRRIVFKIGPCEILLSLDQSIAIGTVVCELLSNSMKHAFPDRKEGTISMDITALSGDRAELIVEDDGKGFDKEFDFENSQSLGLNIMRSTVRGQLDGTIKMESDGDVGTKYIIHFKAK